MRLTHTHTQLLFSLAFPDNSMCEGVGVLFGVFIFQLNYFTKVFNFVTVDL